MNHRILIVLAVLLVAVCGAAGAEIGAIDDVPAATLLLPYFEVDIENADCINTLFSINNASAAPTIAHVVIWSDLSIPVLDFNIYLTGYDVQTINLNSLLRDGQLPRTADVPRDPGDTISPLGAPGLDALDGPGGLLDPMDAAMPGCLGSLPLDEVPGLLLDRLQEGLAGRPTQFDSGNCIATNQGDGFLRGYVTVENSLACSLDFPGDTGYFDVSGVVSSSNQLWGDVFYVDPPNGFASGNPLVHIEASDTLASQFTFYGRYVAYSGADLREPLPNRFGTRFLQGGSFDGGTDLLVWRDSGFPVPIAGDGSAGFACGTVPAGFPLNESLVVAFDEEENGVGLCQGTTAPVSPPIPGDPPCFPWETQRVPVSALETPYDFGWLYLDLQVPDELLPTQAWVGTRLSALGLYSVGYDAVQLNSLAGPIAVP